MSWTRAPQPLLRCCGANREISFPSDVATSRHLSQSHCDAPQSSWAGGWGVGNLGHREEWPASKWTDCTGALHMEEKGGFLPPPTGHLMAEQDAQNSMEGHDLASPHPACPRLIKLLNVSVSQPLLMTLVMPLLPSCTAFLLDTCLTPWNHSLENKSHQLFMPSEKNLLYSIPRKELRVSTIRFSTG